jgi:hypothetical protein
MTSRRTESGSGLLVISVWNESASAEGFRARLTFQGGAGEHETVAVARDPDDVLDAVREWLAAISQQTPAGN